MKDTAGDLARLSPQQRAALEALLWQRRASRPPTGMPEEGIIGRSRKNGPLPLSYAQRRLWFIDQLEPGSSLYNMPVVLRVEGPLRTEVLRRALSEVVRRHEVLRTVFAALEGSPVQVIQPATPFILPLVDLSGLPPGARETATLKLAGEEAGRPFDLACGPLLRGLLLRLAAEEHIAALVMHHIVSDGWSMGILVREVTTLYGAFAEERPSPLPELTVQYADFAAWQHSWLQGEILEREIAFWRRQLAGLPPLLDLATDRSRPTQQSFRGASRPVRLPFELTRRVDALGRREGATLFMVLLAGFQTLLARYSGQDDFAVGSPVAGRNRMEIEGLIGFFVNTLVLRGDLSGEPSFRELLGRVRETALAAHTHQNVPFEKLVQELAPERSLAQSPLFQVMFILQNAPVGSLEVENLRLQPESIAITTAKFDLTLNLGEDDGELAGTAEHSTDLFDATTIDRLILHYQRLLTAAVAAPETKLSNLPMLGDAERQQVFRDWNDTGTDHGVAPLLPLLLARQAEEAPERVAVEQGSLALTAGELEAQARRLAGLLGRQGVRPEDRVAVCCDRSPEMVVILLAVWKAGAAWVPLEPTHPAARLAAVLDDARPAALITGPGAPEALLLEAARRAIRTVDLTPTAALSREGPTRSAPPLTPDHLAYVIYTSGSTGRPKGVLVSHGAIANRLLWMRRILSLRLRGPLQASDTVLQKTPYIFDASIWEIFLPLLAGTRLVLAPPGAHREPAALAREVRERDVTILQLVPSFLGPFLDEDLRGAPLRSLFCGGEALPAPLCERAFERLPGVELGNLYGPTECAIDVTFHPCRPNEEENVAPLGRPLDNLQVWIMDQQLQPVPPGRPGELCAGGAGVARGYLGRPDLTAERFVPDPQGTEPGARLYRTGDLVRQRPDGTVRFLGRIDHQVKIRGVRIELGEVEAALSALPGVTQAVVVAHDSGPAGGSDRAPGDRSLVAYVVGDSAAEGLRAALRERLPEALLPTVFVTLAALPRTPTGKVDRKALPAPERQRPEESWVAPRTPVEEVLAGIWAELLGLERVGAAGHFFDLGGHSLLAARVLSRLRSAFGVEMPLRVLFEAPVLADLAARVEAARRSGVVPPAPPLVPVSREGPLPLSFAQQRLWFIDQLEPGSSLYNMPVALRVEGLLDAGVLALTLGEIERRHEALRTIFAVREGAPVQVIRPVEPCSLPLVDLARLPEGRREPRALALAGEEARRPFDLTRGPLLRGLLLRLAEADHVVVLTMHHIASDGWSVGILVREVAALYAAFAEGKLSPLPELPVQYADFAVWQGSWLQGEVVENEVSFWRQQLADLPPLLELPTDRPRPAKQSFRGAWRPAQIPVELTRQAQALARREGATLFMVLLAAFQVLLARYSGQDDVAVGSPVAGRNRIEIEGLIGFFVNTLVLRGDLTGRPTFLEQLGRVRETLLTVHLHQDMPFERLVQELAPERSLAHSPLFQVMLVLQNIPVTELRVPGLSISPASLPGSTAKFDLTLLLGETPEGLAGILEYATDLFDAAGVDRFLSHLTHLLASAVADPNAPASELRLLDVEEERHLLQSGLDPLGRIWALPVTVHGLFEQQAGRTPDRSIAIAPQGTLSYGELRERSCALASRIRSVLPHPLDRPVALLADPDPLVLAGMLGVLRAGGGFLPLDPRHPDERLAWVLNDAACEVLVTQERYRDRAERLGPHQVLCLEEALPLGAEPAICEETEPRALAYIVYTSGSTGRPKGVQISHESLVPILLWGVDRFGLGGHTRVFQHLSFCFDFGIFEFLTTLLAGGTLVFPGEAAGDPLAFAREIVHQSIDTLHTTPAFARELAAAGVELDSLEILHLGGEALSRDTVVRLRRAAPRAVLYNGYGPTEAAINSSIFQIGGLEEASGSTVPIGRPSANNALYILDRAGHPVPFGVRGDLHVGGPGVGRGYLNRPDLTAERFVPDPFGGAPGGRLYRTGDLVRYRSRGDIEFLGRLDDQVKIRGFRIELGEIEAALLALPEVREAVVVAQQDRAGGGPGDSRLVAYVAGEATAAALRKGLRERLPDSMVPAAFVILEALPLTANGKLNRKALPAPEGQSSEESYVVPRTPLEELLAGIWAEVLGVERVGANDHFFALGGHSLLATRVASRLRAACGIELPLREFFEAPRLSELASRSEAALRAGTGQLAPPLKPVAPGLRRGPLPLSFAQQRLWFFDQLKPNSPVYNVPVALRIAGPLAGTVLALCLSEIVRRHETLRTVFAGLEGSPVQVLQPAVPFVLPVVDLSGLPEKTREPATLVLAGEEAVRPFDLGRGPLLRGVLLRLAEEDHMAALTLHHIVSDGWSMGILVREITALYVALTAGRPSPLPELPVQYADFAVWQCSWLQGEVLEQEIAFWRRQLAGLPPLLELPTDRPRPAGQSYRGATRPFRLSASITRHVEALARREGSTLFMVLLAIFQSLLGRYSRQDDLAVGSPVAGRNRAEVEELIGFFVNTLVLRGDLAGGPTFRDLLGRVRETALAAYLHQDVPFEKLVEELAPERSLAHAPLFQVLFVLQNAPTERLAVRDLHLQPVVIEGTTAKFDLTVSFSEQAGELAGTLEYATDLFDAVTAERFHGHLANLLAGALADPGKPLTELPLMDVEEQRQLLLLSGHGGGAWALPAAVDSLFAEQAGRAPDRIAAVDARGAMTYGRLAEWAAALATDIQAVLAHPLDRPVALLAEPGTPVLAGMLGILRAGAGFVPLDPRHPDERLAWTLADAASEVLLAPRRDLARALGLGVRHVLCLEDALPAVIAPGEPMPREEVGLRALAYVVYTSGSTGRPKGVQISHESLVPVLRWGRDQLGLGAQTRVLQSLSVCFDFGIFEHLTTLLAGGTLIFPEEAAGDPSAFAHAIIRHGINTLHTTPAFARELAATSVCLDSLEVLHLGGEALVRETADRLSTVAPRAALFNGYGPTEVTVNCSLFRVGVPDDDALWPAVPIGRPSADNVLYVLDRAGRLVPRGVPGDLHIGGAGVARGYLARPDLTAERFVPDPFGPLPGGRLYRSGDLVRHRPSGDLEFLGRLDHQVKIRGFRIEPGEIEAALLRHPAVQEAAVLARGGDGQRLVAWLGLGNGSAPGPGELRSFLAAVLPEHMIPSVFVPMVSLPMTPNGKIDRRALPEPDLSRPELEALYVAPRTPEEAALATIWAEVLEMDRVGVQDSFFALGGHSLLGVRLMARIDRVFGVRLPMATLFEAPTVERLAAVIERREAPVRSSPLVQLHPGGAGWPLFLVHPVGGDVFAYVELARRLGTERPVYGLRAVAETAGAGGHQPTVEELAGRYLAAVRQVQSEGPWLLAGWSLGAVIAYEMAQQIESSGGRVALLAMIDPSPAQREEREETDEISLLAGFAADLVRLSGRQVAFGQETLEGLGLDEALDRLVDLGRREGVLPPDLDRPRLQERFDLFRRHAKALRSYVARPHGGRILLFRAGGSQAPVEADPALGWSALARVQIHLLDADHYSVLRRPALDRLVEHLQSELAAIEGRDGGKI